MNVRGSLLKRMLATATIVLAAGAGTDIEAATKPTTSSDGTIVSEHRVSVLGQNPKINVYKVFYMSDGQRVEAWP